VYHVEVSPTILVCNKYTGRPNIATPAILLLVVQVWLNLWNRPSVH